MVSSTPLSRNDSRYLHSVVNRVKGLLSSCKSVYLRANDGAYVMPIWGIRVTRSSKLLQVDTAYGWSTVWGTESLVDESGECLYCSPNHHELELQLSQESLDAFVESIGLVPAEFKIKEVF